MTSGSELLTIHFMMSFSQFYGIRRLSRRLSTTVESICVAHELNPLITESVMQAVRGDLPPVDKQQRCATV